MHPTLEEEIAGVRRILDDVVSDPALTFDTAAAVKDASAMLARLEKSWRKVAPYILADLAHLTPLLVDISRHLPDEMRRAILVLDADQRRLADVAADIARADDLQRRARTLLSEAIELLPPDPPGEEGPLARIRTGLSATLEVRPW